MKNDDLRKTVNSSGAQAVPVTEVQVEDFFILLNLETEEARSAASFDALQFELINCQVNVHELVMREN